MGSGVVLNEELFMGWERQIETGEGGFVFVVVE